MIGKIQYIYIYICIFISILFNYITLYIYVYLIAFVFFLNGQYWLWTGRTMSTCWAHWSTNDPLDSAPGVNLDQAGGFH